ncbi:MAG: hypothetical protein GF334_00330 [Candidatus Altiarchaeales archaeon]|nr:hypothetical protein [Candidatus Altiarchaeales archaeon]
MKNCGRCGKPLYDPGIALCQGCKKLVSRSQSRYADRENRKRELQRDMFDAMSSSGEEDDDKYSVDFWGLEDEQDKYYKKRKRR